MKIHANGIEIGYDVAGEGPWLALCHSLGLDRSMWFGQVPALSLSHSVLTWDARGHGESSAPPGPYDFDLMARDLLGLMDALGVERAAVLGLSMGGDVAIALASAQPERVSALVLSDSTVWFGPGAESFWNDRIAAVKRDGLTPLLPVQAERWFTDSFRTSHPEIVDRILRVFLKANVDGYAATMEALAGLDLRARLSGIRCPTLVVVGREDITTPPSMAEEIHRGIAGSELVVLDNARHLSPVEQAEAFNQAVLDFLARVGA